MEVKSGLENTRGAPGPGFFPGFFLQSILSDDPRVDLEAYTGSYLQEEIVSEGATRNIPVFSRVLKVAAFWDKKRG